jgi:hypothetical protein
MTDTPETLADLLRRHSDPDTEPPAVPRVSLAEAAAGGGDPLDVLAYLAGLGITVRTLDDLLAINSDPDEEEVHSFRVAEGVAVAIASQGEWLLFTP